MIFFVIVSGFLTFGPASWAWSTPFEGLFVSQIAIDPADPQRLYALTTYSIGALKSTDGGQNWTQINQGIRSYSLYQIAVHPKDPKIVYIGAGGAGLYKSADGGNSWMEMNDGLQNTDIGKFTFHPEDPEILYIVTSTGLFKSPDSGASWIALNQGDHFTYSQQFQALIVLPTTPPTLYLASSRGLYTRREGDEGWVPVGGPFEDKRVSALAYDPRNGRLYAAVLNRGNSPETLREGGLFIGDDGGRRWSRRGVGLERSWIQTIVPDAADPQRLWIGTTGRGVLLSTDGGRSWQEHNRGLTDPDLDIRTLVQDPRNPRIWYAGSHGAWLFRSSDGGESWAPLPLGPHQTSEEILAVLHEERVSLGADRPSPPPVFAKCNQCHGWTDSGINQNHGSWRVSANRRDWALTVKRMAKNASLTEDEEKQIASFLNRYTDRRTGKTGIVGENGRGGRDEEKLQVAQIAVDPQKAGVLYAATTFGIGVLKSTDGGLNWRQINQGLKSLSSTQIIVDPGQPNLLYLSDGCAGFYVSPDGGRSWEERNDHLQNTEIGRLVLHPTEAGTLYAVTTQGVYKASDYGRKWVAFHQGDTFTHNLEFPSLLVVPTSPPTFYLASSRGLYMRREDDAGWRHVGESFEGKRISALAHDPHTGRLYAAVLSRTESVETLKEGGLFVSEDGGTRWSRLGSGLERDWIQVVLTDPGNSNILYLGTTGRGVLRSMDGGRSWQESNKGLTDPDRDVRALAADPRNPKHLYAGTHGAWVFQSMDGGNTWSPLPLGPHERPEEILARLDREDAQARRETTVHLPASFAKCNQCHGWTDPYLNRHGGLWRVTANRRDWRPTVQRMRESVALTAEEEKEIADFLNGYTSSKRTEKPPGFSDEEIPISIREGAEEEDPVIAWDGRHYLAAWQSNRKDPLNYDLFGRRLRGNGTTLDPQEVAISTAPSNQIFPDIAWGKEEYLVVWQDLRSGRQWEIYGARLLPDGTVRDPEGIPIAVGERNHQYPRVASDGQNFLVVWMEEREGRGWDIAGVRISPEGKLLDQERIFLAKATGDQSHPALAWGKDYYLVVWMDQPSGVSRISGARVAPSGKLLDPQGLVLSRFSTRPGSPTVSWGEKQFIVVWTDQPASTVYTLSGVRVNTSGEVMEQEGFVVESSASLHTFPSVHCAGHDCLVVWEKEQSHGKPTRGIEDLIRDVKGAWIDLSQKTIRPQEIMIAPKAVGNHFTKVASDGQRYLVVWKDYRTGTAASLGRLVTPFR
jgi:photosystem II stability/assembly factor-like uncharacterized protein